MKIHSLLSNTAFGYNKELNETVNKKLRKAKGNKELAGTMLALNTYCMATEDKLRKAEEEHNQALVDRYEPLLLGVKNIVTNQINGRFPELHYREKELNTYKQEAQKRNNKDLNHWLNQMVLILDDSEDIDKLLNSAKINGRNNNAETPTIGLEMCTTKNTDPPHLKEKTNQPKEINNANDKKIKTVKAEDMVEEFIPGEYSAKGFQSIGGMEKLKEKIHDKVIMPLKNPEQAKLDEIEYGKKMPRGELLYGPPGCGKTYFAEAVAVETGLPMYKFKVSKVGSMYVDGKSINLQKAYNYIKSIAKNTGKPVIMFIDEMDSLTPVRSTTSGRSDETNKAVDTLLQIMDEARNDKVFIIGATNLINSIDPSIANRFDNKDYIGVPDADTRRTVLAMILNKITKGQALANNPEELEKVVNRTKGFPNRTLTVLVNEASDIARLDRRRDITADDFNKPIAAHQDDIVRNENIYMSKSKAPAIGFNHTGHKVLL